MRNDKAAVEQYASDALSTTCTRIGTARSAITSGWRRIAYPSNANSNPSVASRAASDNGATRASAARINGSPRLTSARRQQRREQMTNEESREQRHRKGL